MTVQINYLNKKNLKALNNLILFTNEKFNIKNLSKTFSKLEFNYISDLLKNSDLKKKILVFDISSKKRIILVSIKSGDEISDIESLGAKLYEHIKIEKNKIYFINADSLEGKQNNLVGYFLHGLKLKSYEFNKYK